MKATINEKTLAELFYVYTDSEKDGVDTTIFLNSIKDSIDKITNKQESQLLEKAMEKIKDSQSLQDCGNYTDNTKENDYANYLKIAVSKTNGDTEIEDWMDNELYDGFKENLNRNEEDSAAQIETSNEIDAEQQQMDTLAKNITEELELSLIHI